MLSDDPQFRCGRRNGQSSAEIPTTYSWRGLGREHARVNSGLLRLCGILDLQESSPGLSESPKPLEIILIFDAALHPELSQDRHHLSHGDSGKHSSPAKRRFALLVPFHRE